MLISQKSKNDRVIVTHLMVDSIIQRSHTLNSAKAMRIVALKIDFWGQQKSENDRGRNAKTKIDGQKMRSGAKEKTLYFACLFFF